MEEILGEDCVKGVCYKGELRGARTYVSPLVITE